MKQASVSRKLLFIFSFSILGILFPFVMMLLGNFLGAREQGMQLGGEDELNERLWFLIVYSFSVSMFLWAGVGYLWSLSTRLGLKALWALLLGILLNKIIFKAYYFYFANTADFKTTLIATSVGWIICSLVLGYSFMLRKPIKRFGSE